MHRRTKTISSPAANRTHHMITPTNGRIVWFQPEAQDSGMCQLDPAVLLTAQVCHVFGDRCVNLDVTDSAGQHHFRSQVQLLQDADANPSEGRYAIWMPYQKGQAAKTEALEQKSA